MGRYYADVEILLLEWQSRSLGAEIGTPSPPGITLMSPGCTDMKRATPLCAVPPIEATYEIALTCFSMASQPAPASSSIWPGGIHCTPALLARCRLLGGVLENSHILARTQLRDQHIFLQARTGSMISQEICALPVHSPPATLCQGPPSTRPPGKGRRQEKLSDDGHRNADFLLRLYDGTGYQGPQARHCAGLCKEAYRWGKGKPKCLAAMQPDFGNGFPYKLAFHLRYNQQIGEHKGEHD